VADALDRIKNRQRPTVDTRDSSITKSEYTDTQIPESSDIQISTLLDAQTSTPSNKIPPSIETKNTTLRIETFIGEKLQSLCQQQKICREVFIESMFLEIQADPELLDRILQGAQERQRKRTAIANHKRAVTMMNRL
jgi:hypothetical protein